ncbi:MAG: PfkB family carbohydrate kinase [Balneolaceae bacterium]
MILVLCPNPSVDTQIHVDQLEPGRIHASRSTTPWPGGKGVHVALAARELGAEVELAGFWAGPTGAWIRQECERRGVSTHGPELEGWTRRCVTYLESDGRETEVRETGASLGRSSMKEWNEVLDPLLKRASLVCVSGSWPAGTPAQPYQWLSDRCRDLSIPLWVDASGVWLEAAVETGPYGLHVNRDEVNELLGDSLSAGEAARKLVLSCEVAAVTDGADGLWLAHHDQLVHGRCSVDTVISTVGCGDCLTGGLLAAQAENRSLSDQVRHSVAAGSANCLSGELGLIQRADVERLLPTVELTDHRRP